MKHSNLIIQITEPCHEDWNKMLPDEKGKFCNSCCKAVYDFTNKTDSEIQHILMENKNQKVCGHFKKSQINRPLNISINLNNLPKNINITKAFVIAIFLVFGTFLFSCTDITGRKVDGIHVIDENQKELILGDISFGNIPKEMESNDAMTDSMLHQYTDLNIVGTMTGDISIDESVIYLDTVNLEEVTVVDYMEPLIDEDMISGGVTTGLVSVCSYYNINDTTSQQPFDSTFIKNTDEATNLEIIKTKNNLSVYPNPSNGEFVIKYKVLKKADVRVDIFDMNGILIQSVVNISNQYEGDYHIPLNLNYLANGIYLVNLIKEDEKFEERLVIER